MELYISSAVLLNLSCLEIFHITAHRKNPQVLAVDKDGKNHELSENNENTKLITQYQYLQYNSLMDKKHVSTDLFSVKDGK